MKKMLKLFAAFAMISLAVSFVSCDLATEDELLETVAGNNTPADNGVTPGTSGSGTGTDVSTGGGTGNSSSTSPIWSKFDGADMQVWQDTVTLTPTAEGLDIKVKNSDWWGMCFCNKADEDLAKGAVTFDMTKVKTIKVDAKASAPVTIWLAQSDKDAAKVHDENFEIDTTFKTLTYELTNPSNRDYGVLDIGGNGNPWKTIITIKNIKFLDANGVETTPSRNE